MFLLEFLFCRTGFVIACIGLAVGMGIVNDANRPVYVAVDENDSVMGMVPKETQMEFILK